MKYKMKGAAAAVLAVLMIILSGCGGRKTGGVSSVGGGPAASGGEVSGGGNGGTSSGQQNGGENDTGGGQDAEDPGAGGGQSSEEPSGTVDEDIDEAYVEYVAKENKYRDALLNKKNWQGKFAVFFLRSESEPANPLSGETRIGGDHTLVISPDGKTMLVDCNITGNVSYTVDFLKRLGIKKLDYFVNSHPHDDHFGGYKYIFDNFEIDQLVTNYSQIYTDPTGGPHNMIERFRKETGKDPVRVQEGDKFALGSVSVTVYNPPADTDWENEVANDHTNGNSLALRLTYKKASLWLGGDCEDAYGLVPLRRMAQKYGAAIQTDVVKFNHHGHNMNGCPEPWLNAVKPKIAVGETSNVLSDAVMLAYEDAGASTFHVALDGTVLVTTSGDGTYDIQAEKDRDEFSFFAGSNKQTNGYMRVSAK